MGVLHCASHRRNFSYKAAEIIYQEQKKINTISFKKGIVLAPETESQTIF